MSEIPRKKSPRAPSMALNEALDRATKVYKKERLHAAPTEVIANDLGYKSANNGAAMSAMASLRYFGILERPKEGFLSVSKDVESFLHAPNEDLKKSLLIQFLKAPALYTELLEKYNSGLPSDANLRYELIQRGFNPATAESALAVFKQSAEFSGYYDTPKADESDTAEVVAILEKPELPSLSTLPSPAVPAAPINAVAQNDEGDLDRIPVRLPGGRRAWLLIPAPFYNADKARLKAQIDLLFTEEDN